MVLSSLSACTLPWLNVTLETFSGSVSAQRVRWTPRQSPTAETRIELVVMRFISVQFHSGNEAWLSLSWPSHQGQAVLGTGWRIVFSGGNLLATMARTGRPMLSHRISAGFLSFVMPFFLTPAGLGQANPPVSFAALVERVKNRAEGLGFAVRKLARRTHC